MMTPKEKAQEAFAKGLSEHLEKGDIEGFLKSLRIQLSRRRRMSSTARELGVAREGLYKSLSAQGNPRFLTIKEVLYANGLELVVVPIKEKK